MSSARSVAATASLPQQVVGAAATGFSSSIGCTTARLFTSIAPPSRSRAQFETILPKRSISLSARSHLERGEHLRWEEFVGCNFPVRDPLLERELCERLERAPVRF